VSGVPWAEAGPYVVSVVTALAGYATGRRGKAARAAKDEADAVRQLSETCAHLGSQVNDLYLRLAVAETKASAAESRASAAEARLVLAEAEIKVLRAQQAAL
jgi:hypothetical protein